jgi:hypothetical protein
MPAEQNLFKYQMKFMKFVSMQPLDLEYLPKKLKFLKSFINFSVCFFWHFIVLHLAAVQIQTIL